MDKPDNSGFSSDSHIDKKGTPYGEAARFNSLPPGPDISNQNVTHQNSMRLKTLVAPSYPGDGGGTGEM